jgi:hypothetical protein
VTVSRCRSNFALANPHAFLCHGVVIGNGGDVLGERYWHAWIELDGDQGTICIDRSGGKDAAAPQNVYAVGQVEQVTRYTLTETLVNCQRSDMAGPWL